MVGCQVSPAVPGTCARPEHRRQVLSGLLGYANMEGPPPARSKHVAELGQQPLLVEDENV
jgi:hypothetical protein